MNNPLITTNTIAISAAPSVVWDALINPDLTQSYMHTCRVVSDWKTGSPVKWIGASDGVEYVTGYLLKLEKEKTFSFSVFDPHGTYRDIPENYLVATYTLTAEKDQTILTVTQGDYNKVEGGEKRYNDTMSAGGWYSILEAIKKLVESQH